MNVRAGNSQNWDVLLAVHPVLVQTNDFWVTNPVLFQASN